MAWTAGPLLNHLKRPFYAQRSAPLARWVFSERRKELADDGHTRHHRPQLVAPPASVHHRLVLIALPRVFSQVSHYGNVGRFWRAGEQIAFDCFEAEFPIVVAQCCQITVVCEVEKFVPWSLRDFAFA